MTAASSPHPLAAPGTDRRGDRDLGRMLATLRADAREGEFVFVTVPGGAPRPAWAALAEATVAEAEGLSCVLRRADADAHGLDYGFSAAWLSLRAHSALDAVGLTAAVSTALARHGIACNVVAGFHHDHLLVPADRLDAARDALAELAAAHAA
ncbi:ACT domain-containing protein [Marilutibacter maris]|nr:ACT domain-containing protein [Lysobacter maris]